MMTLGQSDGCGEEMKRKNLKVSAAAAAAVDGGDELKQEDEGVREKMVNFWKEHSKKATEEEMMLDTNADVLGKQEIPEILSMIPDSSDMDVLELGAGIGRFTGHLAKISKSVTAIDFMEKFIECNRVTNGHYANATFEQADVTQLEYLRESFDLVFSNWLLMYLEEHELEALFDKILKWLRPNGYFYFRESCFHQSGNASRQSNPTKYRTPAMYNRILHSTCIPGNDGKYGYKIQMSQSVQTYIRLKSNRNQICWLVQKVKLTDEDLTPHRTFHEYLNGSSHELQTIRSYERIFGDNFVSSGGLEMAEECVEKLQLKPDQDVLVVGSGIGGTAFHTAKTYGVRVNGIDTSADLVACALERANYSKDSKVLHVQFEAGDVTKMSFPSNTYDAIYCGEVVSNVKDKTSLFSSLYRLLKPGGRLVVADYCRGRDVTSWSDSFGHYVDKYGYHLLSTEQYIQTLEEVGFELVCSEDYTDQLRNSMTNERIQMTEEKDDFIKATSQMQFMELEELWKKKNDWCESGDLAFQVFSLRK